MKSSEEPIYECDQCGACCRHLRVHVDELDITREPKLKNHIRWFRDEEEGENDEVGCLAIGLCPLLASDNRCTVYASRPAVCVGFLAGGEQCQMTREQAGLPPLEPIRKTES